MEAAIWIWTGYLLVGWLICMGGEWLAAGHCSHHRPAELGERVVSVPVMFLFGWMGKVLFGGVVAVGLVGLAMVPDVLVGLAWLAAVEILVSVGLASWVYPKEERGKPAGLEKYCLPVGYVAWVLRFAVGFVVNPPKELCWVRNFWAGYENAKGRSEGWLDVCAEEESAVDSKPQNSPNPEAMQRLYDMQKEADKLLPHASPREREHIQNQLRRAREAVLNK